MPVYIDNTFTKLIVNPTNAKTKNNNKIITK